MMIHKAEFLISNQDYRKCPVPNKPEYAFIGRSNVGKSSLINMITNKNKLAKTSSSPGKTQLINHFLINEQWYLVDLPGYGYAKSSKTNRLKWMKMISDYLTHRENLMCTFVLIDSRVSPQAIDVEFMNNLGSWQIPFVIVFTKRDKISQPIMDNLIKTYQETMAETWEEFPQYFITSSEKKLGGDEVLEFIKQTNTVYQKSI
ncbi:MAG: ribosome biogenesis GTP-binding protein YihA/YsxC [Bacteroidales bacterium]|nr:ribosome biogenesis GTP-binding protein YihA/YsxC [Bacteroidales bacterium]